MTNKIRCATVTARVGIYRSPLVLLPICGIFSLCLFPQGCGARHGTSNNPELKTVQPATTTTVPTTAPLAADEEYAGYYFVLSPEKRQNLMTTVNDLPLGTSIEECKRRLGKPDQEAEGDVLRWPRRRHRSYWISYNIARYRNNLVNRKGPKRRSLVRLGRFIWID